MAENAFNDASSKTQMTQFSVTPERCRKQDLSNITLDSGLDTSSPGSIVKSPFGTPSKEIQNQEFRPNMKSTPMRRSQMTTPNNSPQRRNFQDGGQESKTNLIVNYLPQNMTHDHLRELFRSIGEIENCKLVRNKETKLSLGYGFVNYRNAEDAQKAVEQLNGRQIQNKMIKVSFARPSSQHIKNTNLYVAGLPRAYTTVEVRNLFGRLGKIISCRILTCKETGLSRGVAFVRYDTRHEAEMAVENLDKMTIGGQFGGEKITVKFASPIERAEQKIKSENDFPLSFNKVPKDLEKTFSQMMLSYQQINVSGQRRPFSIMNSQDVTNVHKGQNDAQQNGQVLISVANLGKNITEKQIWEIFGPFGAVTNVTITRNNTEQEFLKEGNIATVTMPVYNEALCAINCINNREIDGQKIKVGFQFARM